MKLILKKELLIILLITINIFALLSISGIFGSNLFLIKIANADHCGKDTDNKDIAHIAEDKCPPKVTDDYKFLAPLPDPDKDGELQTTFQVKNTIDASGKEVSALGKYLNQMLKIAIGLVALLALIMIIYGGLEYMLSGLATEKSEGKKKIWNAIFGLILALGSYAILYTINPNLLKVEPNLGTNLKYTAPPPELTPDPDTGGATTEFNGKQYQKGAALNDADLIEANNLRASLLGITINKGECTTYGQENCTSLIGFDTKIIADTQDGCGDCAITVTGGTETWLHTNTYTFQTTHKPGSSTVDFSAGNEKLNKYIMGITSGTFPSEAMCYKHTNDIVYYAEQEPDHWHAEKDQCPNSGVEIINVP
ncbi:MAG: pilin [Patescibacteria group bacterium]